MKGEDWTGYIHLKKGDNKAQSRIPCNQLQVAGWEWMGDDKVMAMRIYSSTALSNDRLHVFLVIETNQHWVSLEKGTKGVFLHAAKELCIVRDCDYHGENRGGTTYEYVCEWEEAVHSSAPNLRDVVRFGCREVGDTYSLNCHNCREFAHTIYNHYVPIHKAVNCRYAKSDSTTQVVAFITQAITPRPRLRNFIPFWNLDNTFLGYSLSPILWQEQRFPSVA
eukprot:GHVN01036026.1.p1 GENE.GHVN01036026.1~~GHVN01036026.1.p1  ORF type:complete len:222 (+),score=10.71 GHVN01036026.1:118-783(+)